jgi:diguanylate cyclase (GGDEF)-like protein
MPGAVSATDENDVSTKQMPGPGGEVARSLMPFAIPAVAGYLLPLVPGGPEGDPMWMATGALLLVLAGGSAVLGARQRLPRRLFLVPPLAYIGVVAALRAAVAGSNPAYAALFLLPLVWLALHGTRNQLGFGLVAAAGALMGSGPLQPEGWIEGAVPSMLVAPVIGFTVLRLAARVGRQAAIIEELAQKDPLTGAVTRRAWIELFDREIVRAERTGEALSVALLDVDGLTRFNRHFGPEAGDDLLRSSVAAWRRGLRAGDILGRIDDDTFGLVLPSCDDHGSRIVVERLRTDTAELQTCSIGVAQWRPGETQDHVMYRVRSALRSAKDEGGDRVVVASINLEGLEEPESEPALLGYEATEALRHMWDEPDAAMEDVHESPQEADEPVPVPALEVAVAVPDHGVPAPLIDEAAAGESGELRRLLRDLSRAR